MTANNLRIKQKALEENIPPNSPLREYLAGKNETAAVSVSSPQPMLVPFCKPFGRYPKTLLVMPPTCLHEGAVKRVIPPLGICYIAGYLEAQGIDVDVLDCIIEGINCETKVTDDIWAVGMPEEEFRHFIQKHEYEVIGFSMIYSPDLRSLYRYAELVKEESPQTIVVAGGMHASIYTKQFLTTEAVRKNQEPIIDFVIRGEGELRMAQFLTNLKDGFVDKHADGLAGWLDNKLFINPQVAVIENIDILPLPAYHKVPLEKYFEYNVPFSPYPRGKRVMQLLTSRGCPIGCTFCASTNFSKKYRFRSVQNVISEINFYKKQYNIDEIQFADDNLTFNRARSLDFFACLKQCELPWCTPNGIMLSTLTTDLLDLMEASGLYQITLSLDSGNAETLKTKHRKPVNLNRIPDLVAYLEEKQVLMHGTLVVGMPGETKEDILKGFNFVEQLPLNSLNVFIAQPIPGSELFEKALYNGILSYEEALRVDTAKSTLKLNDFEEGELEQIVEEFLARYNKQIFDRDPASWHKKYAEHHKRMAKICVGKPSAITSKIIDVI